MLDRDTIIELVRSDIAFGLGKVFPPDAGFQLLEVGEFRFGPRDVRDIDAQDPTQQTAFVPWSYGARHEGLLLSVPGTSFDGQEIPVIDPEPPLELPNGPTPPAVLPTGRPVSIVGATLVVARNAQEEANPVLLRFVDWADVYTQLGFDISTRPPEPGATGFQRIQEVP